MKEMNRVVFKYTIVLLCSFFTLYSCSKEDESEPQVEKEDLVVTPSSHEVDEGESVQFTVTANNKEVANATIYVNNTAITDYEHIFTETGIYQVSAKKEGYNDSEKVEVRVSKMLQLTLTTSANEISEGTEVSFEITVKGESVSADIYINNQKIDGTTFTFESIGTYTVIAKKIGYLDSEAVEIKVKNIEYQVDVYVAGWERGPSYDIAKYWKNGVAYEMSSLREARAYAIVVDNDDVYVGGTGTNISGRIDAKIWKNGEEEIWNKGITDHEASILSMSLYEGNLYAAGSVNKGYLKSVAAYWKNGEMFEIGNKHKYYRGNSISVNENGIHLVGSCDEVGTKAYYWNNEHINIINDSYQGYSVFTTNGDLYMTGRGSTPTYEPKYWKNGVGHILPGHTVPETVIAEKIFVDGEDVHVVGWRMNSEQKKIAIYWKNGDLQELSDGTKNAEITDVVVFEGDVYLSGYESNGLRTVAKLWKNGQSQDLTDGLANAYAREVVVVRSRK